MSSAFTTPGHDAALPRGLSTDSRTNGRMLEFMRSVKADKAYVPQFPGKTTEELRPLMAAFDEGFEALYSALDLSAPGDDIEPEVICSTRTFKSFDGVERKLFIIRPADLKEKAPAVVYIHGGGMVTLSTMTQVTVRWTKSIALQGTVAIAVDFRNAYTKEKDNLFPTGLNDCAAALKYIHAHKEELGIGRIVLMGESGGANLAIATTLKAKREGFLNHVDGVFVSVPYISGAHLWSDERKRKELPSLVDFDQYFLEKNTMAAQSVFYSPNDAENPLAWPYFATVDDVKGLPPHMLVMDELDPVRDEGIAYYRKLAAAGVSAVGRVNLGTVHASSLLFRHALPELNAAAVREIAGFAKSL